MFFENGVEGIELVVDAAIDALREELTTAGLAGLRTYRSPFSSISLGERTLVEGKSVSDIAEAWLIQTSSLHKVDTTSAASRLDAVGETMAAETEARGDRLPRLVLQYVAAKRPSLLRAFDDAYKTDGNLGRRTKSSTARIDFFGSRLAASFGTIVPSQLGPSVDRVKRKLWDLEFGRDSHSSPLHRLSFSMFIQRPASNDPQVSERQLGNLEEAIATLKRQANIQQLELVDPSSVDQIGQAILSAEAA